MDSFRDIVILSVVLIFLFGTSVADTGPVVRIQQGFIRGTTLVSIRSNKTFFGFMGIPYAKPPVGDFRFKEPQPVKPWKGILETKTEGSICPQFDQFTDEYKGDENCLFINVFTPKLPSAKEHVHLPVMVWIHGGDYIVGSGNRIANGPDYLVDENVVIVSFNYRLGVLGFLSLQNAEVPGNNGLKDQTLAFNWIKKNIKSFGGDNNHITIFGQSSGAACVHYHILSPMTRGLFNRAISESGTALNPWAYQSPSSALQLAQEMAKTFGESSKDTKKILQKLKTVSPRLLVTYIKKALLKPHVGAVTGPTLDNITSVDTFLPDIPFNLIKEGKFSQVPYITGVNNKELLFLAKALGDMIVFISDEVLVFELALPRFVGHPIPRAHDMAVEIKNKYFNNSRPLILNYVDVLTDLYFVNGAFCTSRAHAAASKSPVYSYQFFFDGASNALKKFFNASQYPGACHGDELPYLFRFDALQVKFDVGTPEYLTSSRMVKLWTNFAKTGNPTPHPDPELQNVVWSTVSKNDFPYLSIGKNLQMERNLNDGHPTWWEELYKKYVPSATPCWCSF